MASEVLTLSIVLAGISKYVSEAKRAEKATNSFVSAFDNIKQNQANLATAVASHQADYSSKVATHAGASTLLGDYTNKAALVKQEATVASNAILAEKSRIAKAKAEAERLKGDLASANSANSAAWVAGGKSKSDPLAKTTRATRDSIKDQLALQNKLIKSLQTELKVRQKTLTEANAAVILSDRRVKKQTLLVAKTLEEVAAQKLLLADMVKQQVFANSFAGKADAFLVTFGLSLSAVTGLFAASIVAGMALIFGASYKAALEMETSKKKLTNVFSGENGGENAMKWVRAYALTGKATIAELTQALVTLGRLGVQPTAALMEDMNNVAILSGRNMGNIAQGIAFALKGSWWMMQRGLGIRKDDVMKVAPKAFDAKGKVVDRDLALKGIMKIMDSPQYQGAADRMSKGMTGISRKIAAQVKDSLATIGEIPKESVKRVLEALLGVVQAALPYITRVLTAASHGVKLFLDAMIALKPVLKVVTFFTGVWLVQLGIMGLTNFIFNLTTSIPKLITELKSLAVVEQLTTFWTALMEGTLDPLAIGAFALAIVTVSAAMGYAYVKSRQQVNKSLTESEGLLGEIKGATDDTITSVAYMYESVYHKSKEFMDKLDALFNKNQGDYELAISLAEKLGYKTKDINILKNASAGDIIKEYNASLQDLATTQKAIDDGGYKLLPADADKLLKEQTNSLYTAQNYLIRHKNEYERAKAAAENNINSARGYKILPAGQVELDAKVDQAFKDYNAEWDSFNRKLDAYQDAEKSLVHANSDALEKRKTEQLQKQHDLLVKMRDIIKSNNENVRQDIVGGGDLAKLGIAKYAIWKRFGDQFIRTSQNGVDVKIKLTNTMESSLNPVINEAIKQAMEQFIGKTMKLAQ